jgi:hypothetical protein
MMASAVMPCNLALADESDDGSPYVHVWVIDISYFSQFNDPGVSCPIML